MSADYPLMTTAEIRSKFLDFFEEHGVKLYPSSSLVPDNRFAAACQRRHEPV